MSIQKSSYKRFPSVSLSKYVNLFLIIAFLCVFLIPGLNYFFRTQPLRYNTGYSWEEALNLYHWSSHLSLLVFFTLMFLSVVLALGVEALNKKRKTESIKCFLAVFFLIVSFVGFFYSFGYVNLFRYKTFLEMIQRSKPLINAIEKYNVDYGTYPDELEDLVPYYIPKVTSTGIPLYPQYAYKPPDEYSTSRYKSSYKRESYKLWFSCPGFLNNDRIFYWPSKNYPQQIYGGWVERVGDWAYVHEGPGSGNLSP